jgi:hypothetical protein
VRDLRRSSRVHGGRPRRPPRRLVRYVRGVRRGGGVLTGVGVVKDAEGRIEFEVPEKGPPEP